ncbi:divalent-cation tolerance protein CutA [Caldinitratiruptor microaerophilus]|uniref:Divalent ion tolerance protein n=1 Tax=Caldinitratiruptor microaerophilus TaxID=671077 RepID=A0AA35CIE3_9FIRM|nr:divalent-cation tolerance protein CutA [Caldinitratiruptor microaerophilus]BDG59700.1 divalent ion tolerance protein [Caldinitratiruptor microaerophilus]
MTDVFLVYVTTSNEEEAARIGRQVVEERLAACANVVPGVRSFYHWEGRLVEDGEALLLLKAHRERLDDLIARVKALHSYTVPAVNAVPIERGNPDYLRWVAEETVGR